MTSRPRYQRFRQRQLEGDMTLCIAALSFEFDVLANKRVVKNIVCCFDKRTETGTAGSETAFKFRKIAKHWAALFAGSVPRAEELMTLYMSHIPAEVIPQSSIMDVLRKPPHIFKKILADEYVQTRLGMSHEEFIAKGASLLPPSVFETISTDIMRLEIGCQLILVPLHGQPSRHLYTVDTDGCVYPENDFAVIGSGASGASAWLHHRSQHSYAPIVETIRHLIEAKKFSETAPGVGKKTHLLVLRHDGVTKALVDGKESRAEIKRIWERYGPRTPKETHINLDKLLSGTNQWENTAVG